MRVTPLPSDLLVPIFRDARDMLLLTWAGVRAPSGAALDTAAALGRGIHKVEKELTEQLVAGSDEAAPLRLVPAHVERIADAIDGLIRFCQLMEAEGTTFTARGMREVNALFERAVELLECAGDLTLTGNRVLARHVELESMRFKDLVAEYARAHEDRLVDGVCRPASSSAYLGILDYLREITRHAQLIARRIAPRPVPGEGPFPRF
jgi:Na+/phosphate symporter